MIQITAPHFCAGIELAHGTEDMVAIRCAPIVQYMHLWPLTKIMTYVERKGWQIVEL